MRIERILANNPGPFTGAGTNTWLFDDGAGTVAVIDPGPIDPVHHETILQRIGGRPVSGILVTHTHSDHAPMVNPLAEELGVPAIGHAPGPDFEPDIRLDDGQTHRVGVVELEAIHTPGHTEDHLCYRIENVLFTGDHIIGGSSVMVDDLGPYLASLRRLQGQNLERLLPGHGEEMSNAEAVIDWYLAHRLERHEQIYQVIVSGADTLQDVVATIYAGVDAALHPLAARSVRAHVGLLEEEGRIAWQGDRMAVPPFEIS